MTITNLRISYSVSLLLLCVIFSSSILTLTIAQDEGDVHHQDGEHHNSHARDYTAQLQEEEHVMDPSFIPFLPGIPLHLEEYVVRLTDENFESTTQASTGQTTGQWLVWFHHTSTKEKKDSLVAQSLFQGNRPDPTFWVDHHIVVGAFNTAQDGTVTPRRFGFDAQQEHAPYLIYLHRGKLYRHPVQNQYTWESLQSFCLEPHKYVQGEAIPGPPSLIDQFRVKVMQSDQGYLILLSGVVMIIVLGMWISAMIGYFKPAPKEKGS